MKRKPKNVKSKAIKSDEEVFINFLINMITVFGISSFVSIIGLINAQFSVVYSYIENPSVAACLTRLFLQIFVNSGLVVLVSSVAYKISNGGLRKNVVKK